MKVLLHSVGILVQCSVRKSRMTDSARVNCPLGRAAPWPHLWLDASDRAAHDEAVPPHSAVPLGPDPFDLHVREACLGEPLQQDM